MITEMIQRIKKYAQLKIQPYSTEIATPFSTMNSLQFEQNQLDQTLSPHVSEQHTDNQYTRNSMWRALRAALRGDKEAQYQLGLSYLNGQLGLARSYSHAEKWLDQAANQGHLAAKKELQNAYNQLAFS